MNIKNEEYVYYQYLKSTGRLDDFISFEIWLILSAP